MMEMAYVLKKLWRPKPENQSTTGRIRCALVVRLPSQTHQTHKLALALVEVRMFVASVFGVLFLTFSFLPDICALLRQTSISVISRTSDAFHCLITFSYNLLVMALYHSSFGDRRCDLKCFKE